MIFASTELRKQVREVKKGTWSSGERKVKGPCLGGRGAGRKGKEKGSAWILCPKGF